MSVLEERWLHPLQSSHRAMREAGGLWRAADPHADPEPVVAEARSRGIRAFAARRKDLGYLTQLPELEFLEVEDVDDPSPIESLSNLRYLFFGGTWEGSIDFSAFPQLEWFGVVECPRDGGGLETLLAGHGKLRVLDIGRYPWQDLTPLANLQLNRLAIWSARRFSSLQGTVDLAETLRALELSGFPGLESLAGIEVLANLEVLVLESLRHITTLDWVKELLALRYLNVMELKSVASLWPIANHPCLECVGFGRTADLDLEPLRSLPRLKLIYGGSYRWNVDIHEFPHWQDLPSDHPDVLRCQQLRVG